MKKILKLVIFALLCLPATTIAREYCTVTISLADLTMTVRDETGYPLYICPVGVGGFKGDKLLTPVMQGWLTSDNVIKRKEVYFKRMPFIRILDKKKGFTTYGIHIAPTDALVRGYVSHGCVHLCLRDLRYLSALVACEKAVYVRITRTPSEIRITHPYSKVCYRYQNFGTKEKPIYKNNKYGLVIMESSVFKEHLKEHFIGKEKYCNKSLCRGLLGVEMFIVCNYKSMEACEIYKQPNDLCIERK